MGRTRRAGRAGCTTHWRWSRGWQQNRCPQASREDEAKRCSALVAFTGRFKSFEVAGIRPHLKQQNKSQMCTVCMSRFYDGCGTVARDPNTLVETIAQMGPAGSRLPPRLLSSGDVGRECPGLVTGLCRIVRMSLPGCTSTSSRLKLPPRPLPTLPAVIRRLPLS